MFKEIAEVLGRMPSGCCAKGWHLGLSDTKRSAALESRAPLRRHANIVGGILRKAKGYRKSKARRVVALLKEGGLPQSEIAAKAKCTPAYVTYVRKQLEASPGKGAPLDRPKTFVERAMEGEA